jgi:hypothetical protein
MKSGALRRARLFFVCAFTYAFFFSGGDPNQATRYALTESLVVRHAPDITPVHFRTIDKGYKDGRFYADKAPGVSLAATVPFAIMRACDRALGVDPDSRAAQLAKLYVLTLIFSGAAGLLCAVLLRRLAIRVGCSESSAELIAFAYAFGTIAMPFSTVLFGHQLAALLLLGAFVLMVERKEDGTLGTPRVLAALGALFASVLTVEYPTSLLVASFGLGLVAWTFDRKRPLPSIARAFAWSAAGAAPILFVHVAFLVWSYGKVALPYAFVYEPYFRSHMSGGVLGIGVPNAMATYGTLWSSYRGILFFCPVLVLFLAGVGAWVASEKPKRALFVILPALALYMLFACSYYAWDGGGSLGPRHLLPALPYVMLPIAFFADRGRVHRALVGVAAAISSAFMLASTATLIELPQGDVYSQNPLYDLAFLTLQRGGAAINGQDAFIPYSRVDYAGSWGTLLGLAPRTSVLLVAFVWIAAYLPGAIRSMSRAQPRPAGAA